MTSVDALSLAHLPAAEGEQGERERAKESEESAHERNPPRTPHLDASCQEPNRSLCRSFQLERARLDRMQRIAVAVA